MEAVSVLSSVEMAGVEGQSASSNSQDKVPQQQCLVKKRRTGCYDKHEYPEGPTSLCEFYKWPTTVLEKLMSQKTSGSYYKQNIEALLKNGMVWHTDFSGKQCPEVLLEMMAKAMNVQEFDVPWDWLRFHRACDISKLSLHMMKESNQPPDHVFQDLTDRLPAIARNKIRSLRPAAMASRSEAAQAYEDMNKYLVENKDVAFGLGHRSSTCIMHPGEACPVTWTPGAPACGDCVTEKQKPLMANIAGTMCTPWSSYGKRLGLADSATEAWHVWSNEMAALRPDIVTLENSDRFPIGLFECKLPEHKVVWIHLGPQDSKQHLQNTCPPHPLLAPTLGTSKSICRNCFLALRLQQTKAHSHVLHC
jgi:hypothetical protein